MRSPIVMYSQLAKPASRAQGLIGWHRWGHSSEASQASLILENFHPAKLVTRMYYYLVSLTGGVAESSNTEGPHQAGLRVGPGAHGQHTNWDVSGMSKLVCISRMSCSLSKHGPQRTYRVNAVCNGESFQFNVDASLALATNL